MKLSVILSEAKDLAVKSEETLRRSLHSLLRMTSIFLVASLLTGCATSEPVEPLPEITYTSNLGLAVCYATEQVNRAGLLQDEDAFGPAFEAAIGEYLAQNKIDTAAWLAAKEEYFTAEEHTKLVKSHFVRCLVGL